MYKWKIPDLGRTTTLLHATSQQIDIDINVYNIANRPVEQILQHVPVNKSF